MDADLLCLWVCPHHQCSEGGELSPTTSAVFKVWREFLRPFNFWSNCLKDLSCCEFCSQTIGRKCAVIHPCAESPPQVPSLIVITTGL